MLPVLFSSQLGPCPVVGIGFLATSPKEGSGSSVFPGVTGSLSLGARPVKPQGGVGPSGGRTCCVLLVPTAQHRPGGSGCGWVGGWE